MLASKHNLPDVLSCLLIGAFGVAVAVMALDYQVGTLTRMGPGFFPIMSGMLVAALALGSAIEAARASEVVPQFRLRPIFFVSISIIVWTMLIEPAGIIPSTAALVGISSMARSPFRPLSLLGLTVGLCLTGYFVFIGLGMPLTMLGR